MTHTTGDKLLSSTITLQKKWGFYWWKSRWSWFLVRCAHNQLYPPLFPKMFYSPILPVLCISPIQEPSVRVDPLTGAHAVLH